MRFLGHLGGGLGDIFLSLYHHSQYQILPLVKNDIIVDLVVECCNPAVKSVLDSLENEQGNPLFRDIIYRDLFYSRTEESKSLFAWYREGEYCFLSEQAGRKALFEHSGVENPYQYGYFHGKLYHHRYVLTYQEQEYLNRLSLMPYIVIHPSGGLQTIDGLTRDEYVGLITLLLAEFPSMRVLTIGADHKRVWVDNIRKCAGCENYITISRRCVRNEKKSCVRYGEKPFSISESNFLDLTNRTSGALCAKIVEGAAAFIGCHSGWINLFWNFNKPAVCILSDKTDWGTGEEYIQKNGCRWGFSLQNNRTVIIKKDKILEEVYSTVTDKLKEAGI